MGGGENNFTQGTRGDTEKKGWALGWFLGESEHLATPRKGAQVAGRGGGALRFCVIQIPLE